MFQNSEMIFFNFDTKHSSMLSMWEVLT